MFCVLCSGAPWRDLPERYGRWQTVNDRFRRYRMEGFFDVLLARLQLELNQEGLIDFALWEVDSTYARKGLRRRRIKGMIPERGLRPGAKRRKKGPHHRFDKETYKRRASVEHSIGWVKEGRRIATRYEKLAVSFMAIIKLAFIRYHLKNIHQTPLSLTQLSF